MSKKVLILGVLLLLTLTACGGGDAAGEDKSSDGMLNADHTDALPVSSQLAVGTLLLEGTEDAVTVEQATELLTVWQMLQSLQDSGTAADAEIDSVLKQIQRAMSSEQLAAIQSMELTTGRLTELAQELGLARGFGGQGQLPDGFQLPAGGMPGGGAGGRPGMGGGLGQGQSVDAEEQQAMLAERVNALAGSIMTRMMISLLEARVEGEDWQGAAANRGYALQPMVLATVYEATGLAQQDVLAQTHEGQTLSEILEANGADVEAVAAQVVAAETERVKQAVAEGTLDQEQADQQLADLEARVYQILEQPLQFGGRNQ